MGKPISGRNSDEVIEAFGAELISNGDAEEILDHR